jgi:hypothetical protein
MRRRDIQHLLQDNLPKLGIDGSDRRKVAAGTGVVFHRRPLEEALAELWKLPALRKQAHKALQHEALKAPGEPTTVMEDQFADLNQNNLVPLRQRGEILLDAIDLTLPEENPLSFSFQMPDKPRDINIFVEDLEELKLIFDEPISRLAEGRTTVTDTEHGSIVVDLEVASLGGLVVVGLLSRGAKTLMDTYHRYKVQHEERRSLSLANDVNEAYAKADQAALEQVTRRLSEAAVKTVGRDFDNEAVNLVAVSMNRLRCRLEQGAKVTLAANAPEEAKKLMPKPDEPPLLHEAVIKELLATNPSEGKPDADAELERLGTALGGLGEALVGELGKDS